jgi:hypothetical protein
MGGVREMFGVIDAYKWIALTDRYFQKFMGKHGVPRHEQVYIRLQLQELHGLFREHMIREA